MSAQRSPCFCYLSVHHLEKKTNVLWLLCAFEWTDQFGALTITFSRFKCPINRSRMCHSVPCFHLSWNQTPAINNNCRVCCGWPVLFYDPPPFAVLHDSNANRRVDHSRWCCAYKKKTSHKPSCCPRRVRQWWSCWSGAHLSRWGGLTECTVIWCPSLARSPSSSWCSRRLQFLLASKGDTRFPPVKCGRSTRRTQ